MKKTFLLAFAAAMMVACNCSGGQPQKELDEPKDPDPVQTDPQPDPDPDPAQEPTETEPVTYRIGTYNVGVFSKSGTNTTEMVAAMMKEIGVQVLSMNELDYFNGRHNVNQIGAFASAMGGWYSLFAPALTNYQSGQYGVGVAAHPDLKVLRQATLKLAKGDGSEQRALAVVEFEPFVFASTHLDHKSATAQLDQAKTITEWMAANYGSTAKPVFLCGDFNALPTSATIQYMRENWTVISPEQPTYNAKAPSKCIDYIMVYKNAVKKVEVLDAQIPTAFKSGDVTIASDHLPVYVDVKLAE